MKKKSFLFLFFAVRNRKVNTCTSILHRLEDTIFLMQDQTKYDIFLMYTPPTDIIVLLH